LKKIISVLLAILMLIGCMGVALASDVPQFTYSVSLTDASGKIINNLTALQVGDKINVTIDLTRTDITENSYEAYAVEFKLTTNGLSYNGDGTSFREGTKVRAIEYFDGLVTGITYLDLGRRGETVANPLCAASWSYTVEDPAAISFDITTAIVCVTGYDDNGMPVQLVTLTLDPAGGVISGDVSGEYEEGSVVILPTATRSGYTFDGWSDGVTVYPAGAELVLTNSMEFVAKWSVVSAPIIPPVQPDTPDEPDDPEKPGLVKMPFVDVPKDSYYYDAVEWAVIKGITDGTSDTTFSPNMGCTRAQMVTFLWRANGCPEPKSQNCVFEDVNLNSYYGKALLWAIEEGITDGTSDTTFSPDMVCSRAHMATFLYRMTEGKAVGHDHPFTDVPANEYFANPVQWAFENKVTDGTTDTTYSPHNTCSRAQMVVFLYRLLDEA